jgi:hypothetical protein
MIASGFEILDSQNLTSGSKADGWLKDFGATACLMLPIYYAVASTGLRE